MLETAKQEIIVNRKLCDFIEGLFEKWFDDNKVFQKQYINVPLVVSFQEIVKVNEKKRRHFYALNNYKVGNC